MDGKCRVSRVHLCRMLRLPWLPADFLALHDFARAWTLLGTNLEIKTVIAVFEQSIEISIVDFYVFEWPCSRWFPVLFPGRLSLLASWVTSLAPVKSIAWIFDPTSLGHMRPMSILYTIYLSVKTKGSRGRSSGSDGSACNDNVLFVNLLITFVFSSADGFSNDWAERWPTTIKSCVALSYASLRMNPLTLGPAADEF